MIDLSNNNGTNHDFRKAFKSGQRRLYVKLTEGLTFVDPDALNFIARAHAVGFKCGVYHFGHPEESAEDQAKFFASHIPANLELYPCLDIETGEPGGLMNHWIASFLGVLAGEGRKAIIYSYSSFLSGCYFHAPPAPLWLAAYGRNDGKEYPVDIPKPWTDLAAHQYTSRAKVLGIDGLCDLSHVLHASQIDRKEVV